MMGLHSPTPMGPRPTNRPGVGPIYDSNNRAFGDLAPLPPIRAHSWICPAGSPFGRGWLWFGLLIHSNSPLRPAAVDKEGGQSERHRVSPPHARSWLCPHLPIDTHCTHVRAGLLLLRASVPRPRLAAPFPPVLPAARANGTRAAQSRAYTNNRVAGGRVGKN